MAPDNTLGQMVKSDAEGYKRTQGGRSAITQAPDDWTLLAGSIDNGAEYHNSDGNLYDPS